MLWLTKYHEQLMATVYSEAKLETGGKNETERIEE